MCSARTVYNQSSLSLCLVEQFSMSSIITGILSSTVGLLANKVRDSTAAELKDGGFTDTKIREFVVRELNDIKTKLDALSLKELKYSYVGLKEGVNFIYVYLYNSNELDQEAAMDPTQEDRVEVSRIKDAGRC